ncbi:hypothetical protein GPUN_1657 [Glaciecola punicea ACAM 611]|uniref:Uncharacterized protein n=1 Tax=Glaciecola punicea ACAM 611 TaxID=1121923 RepID=H5TBU7_9ALTE|nr:hypothetical protein GPUN_1657 [Glaciecola punicea ACAM 611]
MQLSNMMTQMNFRRPLRSKQWQVYFSINKIAEFLNFICALAHI